ncbi:DUF4411 family protein [Rothia sp. HMSC036D11]|uniref:DUF4411 family protein n=1 Tax=Rothia sp. HMSC036D11 TaxID=1739462 RepID=UPI0008BF57D1|nr:DUF4411 family protein [Rothia sp. HMSC036D11]OFQ07860.1 hypothetical protein HMPREF2958_05210 [Rothia sp. HMSC036D11]
MSSDTIFLLDTNVLVEAHRRYYAHDIVPSYWRWLHNEIAQQGRIISILPVYKELIAGKDELAQWAKEREKYFKPLTQESIGTFREVADWAQNKEQYKQTAKNEFLSVADSSIVAFAKAHDYTVVTLEQPAPESRKRILIPDACHAHGVKYCDPFEMMRYLGGSI